MDDFAGRGGNPARCGGGVRAGGMQRGRHDDGKNDASAAQSDSEPAAVSDTERDGVNIQRGREHRSERDLFSGAGDESAELRELPPVEPGNGTERGECAVAVCDEQRERSAVCGRGRRELPDGGYERQCGAQPDRKQRIDPHRRSVARERAVHDGGGAGSVWVRGGDEWGRANGVFGVPAAAASHEPDDTEPGDVGWAVHWRAVERGGDTEREPGNGLERAGGECDRDTRAGERGTDSRAVERAGGV